MNCSEVGLFMLGTSDQRGGDVLERGNVGGCRSGMLKGISMEMSKWIVRAKMNSPEGIP